MKESEATKNAVFLEGPVCSCKITKDSEKAVIANVEICTAAKQKGQSKTRLSNPMIHRATVIATGENADKLRALAQKTIDMTGDLTKLDFISIDGKITANQKGQQFVSVQQDGVRFPKQLTFKNTICLEGEVMETSYNNAYAGAVLRCKGENNTDILIPINIYSKDNPRKYSDLCSGKINKGEILTVKGPLISRYYSNGQKEVYRCSVNVNNYETPAKKKTQQKKTGMSV